MNLHFGNMNVHSSKSEREDRFMFNMQNVGKKINQLRKAANMTQMELADRLQISFQAVSNWERGESMPDISKLPELAEILHTSIDELLGDPKEAKIIENIIENKPQQDVAPEEFIGVAPLLKPAQVSELFESVKEELDQEQLAVAAPFLSQEFVDKYARKKVQETGKLSAVLSFAPFISDVLIDEMALGVFERTSDLHDIVGFAPFISESVLNDLAKKILEQTGSISKLSAIAPFLGSDFLDNCALKTLENGDLKDIAGIAPFISSQTLNEIAKQTLKDKGLKALAPILPFLDSKLLEAEIEKILK